MDMATSLKANPEWIDCPEITAAIEAVEHKRPTEPTKPTRDPTTKEYDELLLSAWKTEYAEWKKKVKAYDQMANAAAALIFTKYCSKEMQTKLRALEDYEEKVKLDPVEMLKRIKALVSAGTTRQHPMVRFVRNIKIGFNPQLEDGQSVANYCRVVKTNADIVIEATGWDFLDAKTKKEAGYTNLATTVPQADERKKQEEAYIQKKRDQFYVHLAYDGIPRGRFANFQQHIEEAYACDGTDLFAKDLDQLRETLSSERFNKPSQEYLDVKKALVQFPEAASL